MVSSWPSASRVQVSRIQLSSLSWVSTRFRAEQGPPLPQLIRITDILSQRFIARDGRDSGTVRPMGDTVNAVDLPELLVAGAGEWRRWLKTHHADSPGVWLVLAKKGTSDPTTISYDEALDEAICFGWIDGQLGRRDTATFRRRFTPRKARSPWSQRNAAIAERLIATGRMDRSGEDEVRQAKEDGRWQAAYAGQASIEVPEDLLAALNANPRAKAMFDTLTSANRYAILYRIGNAKKPETRSRRVGQFVEMLARGETIHPQVPRSPE